MADTYTPVASERDIQVLGPTNVIDVEMVTFDTKPTGIRVVVPIPLTAFNALQADFFIAPLAEEIEGYYQQYHCIGAVQVQDVDPGTGLLEYFIDYTIQVNGATFAQGPFTGVVRVPMNDFGETGFKPSNIPALFDAGFAALNNLAGL